MKKAASVALLTLVFVSAGAQSPFNVGTNLRWWLKADAGVYTDNGTTLATDGQSVQQWNDQSTIVNHARQTTAGNKPVYRTSIINGNPVLRFSTDQFLDALAVSGIGPTDNAQMFIVFKQNSYVSGGSTDGAGTYLVDRTTATNNLFSFKIINTDKYYYQKRNDTGGSLTGPVSVSSATLGSYQMLSFYRTVGTAYGIYINGKIDVTSGGDSENITGPTIRLGRHATNTNGGLDGDIAEVIVYNANPTPADRLKIHSYLAIKYGITIDQSTATNYINPIGAVIYPAATTHDAYDQNIAGIGRENTSGLNQTSSQSQNSQSIVRIFNPSSLDNGDFLIWGNDAPTIWNSSDVPTGYVNRISRVWRVAETGETGTFSISFDLTGLGMDMSDPSKFAFLIDDNGVFTDATAYTTGRTIVGNVVTFTGAGINTNQYFSLASSLIPGPGGVAAAKVWLRADEQVYVDAGTTLATNGQTIQQWNTLGGITGATASQSTAGNRPTYVTNVANGNPVVRFATTKFLDFGSLGVLATSDLMMSMTFRPATITGGTISDNLGSYMLDRTTATTPRTSLKLLSTNKIAFQERTDAGTVDGPVTTSNVSTTTMQIVDFYRRYASQYGITYNGALEATLTETGGNLTFPTPRLGALQSGAAGLDGDISEFILYNRDITSTERNRIDSYLAIKYGVTLSQATLQNYTASDGVVIYPATSTHSGYVADIAGIGKDAVSRLTQSNSMSANAGAVVRVRNASSLDDLDFFIWGDNAGSLTTSTTTGVDGVVIKRRLSRIWRVAERGDVGTTDISFDLTNVPGAKVQADLRLMIDRDGDGFADNDVTPVTGTLAGQVFTVSGINLQNNDYFTIGTVNATTTPLPIQLVSFDVVARGTDVIARWKTATELDNDYFTLERSMDGEKFVEALRVPGAGTSTEPRQYEALDFPFVTGVIYYRLKQTDFDKKVSYSEVKRVKLDGHDADARIYPNPVENNMLTTELPGNGSSMMVDILNSAGQTMYTGTAVGSAHEWNLEALPRGIYIVKVRWEGGVTVKKVFLK